MTAFLLITVYAPLASWGEIAVGEHRMSWDRPSRSGLLGLLAAALGLDRSDQLAHDALDQGYGVAVRLDIPGTSLIDYHTVQTVAETEIKKHFRASRPTNRADLLSITERQTVLSRRELRQDSLATACIWAKPDAQWALDALQSALRCPHYTLYAGRKANVLGLPLAPEIVEADSLAGALATRQPLPGGGALPAFERLKPRGSAWGREVAHDPLPDGVASGLEPSRTEIRRDGAAQRTRWQFAARTVSVGLMPQVRSP